MEALLFLEALEAIAASGQPLYYSHTLRIIKQRLDALLAANDALPYVSPPAPNVIPAPNVSPAKSSDSGVEDAGDSSTNVSPPAPNVSPAKSSDSGAELSDVSSSSKEYGVIIVFLNTHNSAVPCSTLLVL